MNRNVLIFPLFLFGDFILLLFVMVVVSTLMMQQNCLLNGIQNIATRSLGRFPYPTRYPDITPGTGPSDKRLHLLGGSDNELGNLDGDDGF